MKKQDSSQRVQVGRIVGAFGLRGQLKVELLTDFEERLAKGSTVFLDGLPLVIQSAQWHKNQLLLGFREVPDLTAAEKLQWKVLEADAADRPELEQDEYLTSDLVGMAVFTSEGRLLGTVDAVHPYPAHDVIEVESILIPAVKQFVKEVDVEGRKIVVELIEGME
jgi:16S rRNA processing protein RimM